MSDRTRLGVRPLAVTIREQGDVAPASLDARSFAREAGLAPAEQVRIATVVAELASNIAKYAEMGWILLTVRSSADGGVLTIEARDRGDGIEDIDAAMLDHESSGGTLGLGLPGVRRLVDEFSITSTVGFGTVIRAQRRLVER